MSSSINSKVGVCAIDHLRVVHGIVLLMPEQAE
jgi:hypothetical protein